MKFEWDEDKRLVNIEKHGIDFAAAQALWLDPDRLEIRARSLDETRNPGHWNDCETGVVGVHHCRGDRVRIISVTRARDEEEKRYFDK